MKDAMRFLLHGNVHSVDGIAYFARTVIYARKIIMKLPQVWSDVAQSLISGKRDYDKREVLFQPGKTNAIS
jgi:hypothetical protein